MNNRKVEKDYKLFHESEKILNTINYEGIEIGTLLSSQFDKLYNEKFKYNLFQRIINLFYYFIKPVKKGRLLNNHNKEIVYYQTGRHRHLMALQKILKESEFLNTKTLFISNNDYSDIGGDSFFLCGMKDQINILYYLLNNRKKIRSNFLKLNLSLRIQLVLFIDLNSQLLKAISLLKIIRLQKKLKLIIADYDRGQYSSLMFAVAKARKVKGITLQHGVINPPIGYSPTNANEIWVWGNMAKEQLLNLKVPESEIRITGTPILHDIKVSLNYRKKISHKYGLNDGKNIILALSSPDKSNEVKLVDFLKYLKNNSSGSNDNFFVKTHPGRRFHDYKWIKDIYNIDVLPHNVEYQELINIVDILLTDTSGLAAEVLHYKKKVGIISISNKIEGNGRELHKYFNIPSIIDFASYLKLYNSDNIEIGNYIFFKTGKEAAIEIELQIKDMITV